MEDKRVPTHHTCRVWAEFAVKLFIPDAIRVEKNVKKNQKAKNVLHTQGCLMRASIFVPSSFAKPL